MSEKYADWMGSLADDSKKALLKTLDKVLTDADTANLSSSELDKIKDCWKALSLIESYEHSHVDMAAAAMRTTATAAKPVL